MKKALSFIFVIFFLLNGIVFAADTPSIETIKKAQDQRSAKEPDFSPPRDLTGPIFPPEDLIGEPAPETNRFLNEVVNMMATLGLIISVILIFAWFLKRMLNTRQEQANTTSLIKVIERRSLSPKTAIYLLEVEGKSMIISESVNGVTRLANYDSPEEVEEEPKEIPSTFNKLLKSNQPNNP